MDKFKQFETVVALSERARLLQFIEECNEAAKAAAKLVRILDNENPTPVTEKEARENLLEEIADLDVCLTVLPGVSNYEIRRRAEVKMERWAKRLEEHQKPENTARWTYDPNGNDWGLGAWKCSKCGANNNNLPGNTRQNILLFAGSKFCPQCGRRIIGVQDPEEGGKA